MKNIFTTNGENKKLATFPPITQSTV